MNIKDHIDVAIQGRVLEITVKVTDKGSLNLVNTYVSDRLEMLIDEEIVKYFKNRIDFFVVWPQSDVLLADLKLDVEKRLGI